MRLPRRLDHGQLAELVDHLDELRSRLLIALGSVVVASGVAFAFHRRIVSWLMAPLPRSHGQLLTLGVAEPFTTSLKVSIAAGFAIAVPLLAWQLWSFVAPAVDRSTQRSIRWLTIFAGVLMLGGITFGYRVALPAALRFLTQYDSSIYNIQIRAADYVGFALLVLAACGAVFELPVVVLGLVRIGAVTSTQLRRNRRIGYMIVAVLGVALPGIDPVTTIMETIPLALLYEGSIWLAVSFEKKWRPAAASTSTV